MRALIVDDSRFLRHYLRQLLEGSGVTCDEAADGTEAIQRLNSDVQFDFMLMDVNMPGMSGIECVQSIREQRLQPPMKVVVVTTEADHSFVQSAIESGADEYLMKPFTPASLKEKLMMLGLVA